MAQAGQPKTRVRRVEAIFHVQQAFKLALSLVLYYWLALWVNWDEPQYGALAIVIVSLGTTGASIETGVMRVVGTTMGVATAFLVLGLFNHDRWATMLAFASHMTVMGYFMQTSRHRYAWYAAAFIPLVVWADNYPQFDSVFYFGTFRFLTTVAGILIYTMVDVLLWPRQAGQQLNPLGRDLWAGIREQFRICRVELEGEPLSQRAADLRTKVAGTLARTLSTLQQAYFDTPDIGRQKKAWEAWRLNVRALVNALEIWRETIDHCRELDLQRLVPELEFKLEKLDQRLERISALWEYRQDNNDTSVRDDTPLLQKLSLDLDRPACLHLSHFDRAAVMSFVQQWEILDRVSCELLRTTRVLVGLDRGSDFRVASQLRDRFQPSRWDPGRLMHALFPAVAFVAAFIFWILVNPPGGPKVAMFAGVLSIMILRTPMKPLPLWLLMLLSTLFAVAPIYWLVMPALSTGYGLLALVFIYAFVFGLLGGRSPALKSGPLVQFVMIAGISNEQHYSFQGLVDGALMTLLAGAILTVVYYAFAPLHPEQALLWSLRRCFHGCSRVLQGFAGDSPGVRATGRKLRKRYFESMVLPTPAKIQAAQNQLDYQLYPENSPEKVQRLLDCIQTIIYRLESLQIAHDRLVPQASVLPEELIPLREEVRETAQRVFEHWANLGPGDAFEQHRDTLQQLSRDLQQQLDALETAENGQSVSDRLLADVYTMLGAVRGLVEAMANAQGVINQINWQQWATARF